MIISKTVKKAFFLLVCTASAYALYLTARHEKECDVIRRDNIALNNKIQKLKKQVNQIEEHFCKKDLLDEDWHESKEEMQRKYTHTLKEYNGIIGVYDGEGSLIREVDITVDSLPDADRQDLLIGIRVYSSDELERILDEFN